MARPPAVRAGPARLAPGRDSRLLGGARFCPPPTHRAVKKGGGTEFSSVPAPRERCAPRRLESARARVRSRPGPYEFWQGERIDFVSVLSPNRKTHPPRASSLHRRMARFLSACRIVVIHQGGMGRR